MRIFLTPLLLISAVVSCSCQNSGSQPNILIVLSDDLTYHDLGCYGNTQVLTPNIDRLAKEGMRFNYCFNSSPMCAPTRMSLYTGIHPVRNGAYPNHSKVYDHIRSLPHYLSKEGYRSALIGKKHILPTVNFPFEFLGEQAGDNGGGKGLDLDLVDDYFNQKQGKPWCLVVASKQPHTPWTKGDSIIFPPDNLQVPPYMINTKETRSALSKYYAEINYFDNQLGKVLQHLDHSGQVQNTVVIYLSEQGSNFPHAKWTCYDNGLRSAAIIKWPGDIGEGTMTQAMIQYVDVVPTLLDIVGGDFDPEVFDGRSFADVLEGRSETHHHFVYGCQTSRGIHNGPEAYAIRTVRTERFRLIWNLNYESEFSNNVTALNGPYGVFGSWRFAAKQGDPKAATYVRQYIRI